MQRPDWKKWARDVAIFIGNSTGGNLAGKATNYFLDTVVGIHSEEIQLLHNLAKDHREGYYKAALVHMHEAKREYIAPAERARLLEQARERLFDCIGRAGDDQFLISISAARVGDLYLLLNNFGGAGQWYAEAVNRSKDALTKALLAESLRSSREDTGMKIGMGAGMGLALTAAFLVPPLGAAALGVQLLGGAAFSLGGMAATLGLAGAGAHLASKTVDFPYDAETVREFRGSLRTLRSSQAQLFLPDVTD
ncbi:MAG TPA: hypothetical protein VHC97_28490 [Thermoanaerobaculia bacterium]|jgi:hypothetical protein|nr:hypothetical protein [Thermoanaerobaculia bacterium]